MVRILVVLCIFLSGCTTALWSPKYEVVELEGFYVNPSAGDLIVTSGETAYIFPIEAHFVEQDPDDEMIANLKPNQGPR